MRTSQHQDTEQSKQRLRREISNHIEDFLHKGGRIEVVTGLSPHSYLGHRSATAELALIPGLLDE